MPPREREKTRECPECRQFFTVQGLSGHLRMQHKLSPEEAAEVLASFNDPPAPPPEDAIDVAGSGKKKGAANTPSGFPAAAVVALAVVAAVVLASVAQRPHVIGCAACGARLDVSEALVSGGDLVRCPECAAVIRLP